MKFLLEAGLEKLARWLLFLGQDVQVLSGPISKKEITKHPDRVFITTSRYWEKQLKAWRVPYFLLPKEDWKVQLKLLIRYFRLKPSLKLDRCVYCNTLLEFVEKDAVKDRVPEAVYKTAYDFSICSRCGHVYWKGSHYKRITSTIKSLSKSHS